MQKFPPLSLYVHIPWCVQKCPYCDFNSHAQKGTIPEQEYVQHLIADLEADLEKYQASIQNRPLHSIFIGGGTPSLFSAESIKLLLAEIQRRIPFSENIEITMEANPGTVEAERFKGYVDAGVTRISMGIQSFNDDKLQRLGRIHNAAEAKSAVSLAKVSGLKSFNLDLMHGLPNQTLAEALDDLRQAIELAPPHLSWYQLTIEPNTMFAYRPPTLPDDDELWDIFEQGHQLLTEAGYQQYETSAYAKPGFQCQHNLNYWRFGDYLAIGCGAHGKLTFPDGKILELLRQQQIPVERLRILGSLKTIRYEKQHEIGLFALDENYYFNKNDFELEVEVKDFVAGRQKFADFLQEKQIEYKTGKSKIARFAENLSNS